MRKIAVIGGDYRQIALAREFAEDGNNVRLFGFNREYIDSEEFFTDKLSEAVSDSDIIITGLPSSADGITINTPLYSGAVYIDDLLKYAKPGSLYIGGMINDDTRKKIGNHLIISDYYEREELIIKNTVPTAEGAIAIAINETPVTIHKSKCLVIGYGRIGKYLSKILNSLGADVTVSARKCDDFAKIYCCSYRAVKTDEIYKCADKFDIVFNTVPHTVINSEFIDRADKNCVIIDLASKPGGIDLEYAKLKGIKTIWALSLPGKTAPITAGRIIKETTDNLLSDLGV